MDTMCGQLLPVTVKHHVKKLLLNFNPPSEGFIAIRIGDWKLIIGQPNCSMEGHKPIGDGCPDSWVHLDGLIDHGSYTSSLTWLFIVKEDPNERILQICIQT